MKNENIKYVILLLSFFGSITIFLSNCIKQSTEISSVTNIIKEINLDTEDVENNLKQSLAVESVIKEIANNQENIIQNEKLFMQTKNFDEKAEGVMQVISDYLQMNSLVFQEKYEKDKLYEKGILYCDKESWKYDGNQLDIFQDDYFNVDDITAIRIYEKQSFPVYNHLDIGDRVDKFECNMDIFYNTDYAVSIYKYSDDTASFIKEISFIKIKLDNGVASEELYHFIESNYYDVMESLESELWISSPDGNRAVCVSNGALPKHPAQIFIWNGDDKPFTVYRRLWEQKIVGWIDNEHLICYAVDMGNPVLLHLEREEIESVDSKKSKYDTYGTKYNLQGKYLIAEGLEGQLCKWEILEESGEVFVVEENGKNLAVFLHIHADGNKVESILCTHQCRE